MMTQPTVSTFSLLRNNWVKFIMVLSVSMLFLQPLAVMAAAPAAQNLSVVMNEDSTRNIKLRAGTTDRTETLTYSVVSQPTHGSVSLSDKTATYVPATNYNGSDSFTYQAVGSWSGASNVATVSVTVTEVNDTPVATPNISATTQKNTPVSFQLSGTDVDGDTLTCSAGSDLGGTFTVDSSTCLGTFTPTNNFTGTGSASFKVNDGKVSSLTASVTVTVQETNAAPVVQNLTVVTNEDVSASTRFSATDADMDALTFSVVTPPAHGTATVSDYTVVYIPSANYNGQDSFT